jgi:hypothetical protein
MWTILLQFSAFSAPTSVPIPKLASFRATHVCELWNRKNQQLIDLLRFWLGTPHLGANRRKEREPPHRNNNPMIPVLLFD